MGAGVGLVSAGVPGLGVGNANVGDGDAVDIVDAVCDGAGDREEAAVALGDGEGLGVGVGEGGMIFSQ